MVFAIWRLLGHAIHTGPSFIAAIASRRRPRPGRSGRSGGRFRTGDRPPPVPRRTLERGQLRPRGEGPLTVVAGLADSPAPTIRPLGRAGRRLTRDRGPP